MDLIEGETVIKYPNAQALDLLGTMTAVDGQINGCKIKLFKSNIVPTPATPLSAFDEADFSGYAVSSAVVWGTPYYQSDGTAIVVGGAKTFTVANPATTPNVVYGYFVVNGAADTLLFSERFSSSVNMATPGQGLTVEPVFSIVSQS